MVADVAAVAPETVPLPDGRILAWYEFGAPDGVPCVQSHGSPMSGLGGGYWDQHARAAGVRMLAIDKPGYGHSSFDPRRSLLRYADDVTYLIDHHGLGRVALIGESGGGPHALALAYRLAGRASVAHVVSGVRAVADRAVRADMVFTNQVLWGLATHAPWGARLLMTVMARNLTDPVRREKWVTRQLKNATAEDLALLASEPDLQELTVLGLAGAFRQGSKAAGQELSMLARPWGFALEDVTPQVELWHGTADDVIPIAAAQQMLEQLPRCTPHFFEGERHGFGIKHREEMLQIVVASTA